MTLVCAHINQTTTGTKAPTCTEDGVFDVEIALSYGYEDAESFEPDEVCGCVCHYKGFKHIYYRFMAVIWKLFRVNEYCACGTWHWN